MEIKTAAALRIKHLYHYQSFAKAEHFVRIFTEGSIYFSTPRNFNDPWDCRPCFNKSVLDDPEEYKRTVRYIGECGRKHTPFLSEEEFLRRERKMLSDRKFFEKMIDQMTSVMAQAIQTQYRVYCLSIHPDSILMWSHYTDKCKGLCLEFSVQNQLFCSALQVQYFDQYPIFCVSDTDDDSNIRPLLTKSKEWAYEQEFRVIASEHPCVFQEVPTAKQGLVDLPQGALQSVIVGPSMKEDRELVRQIVKKSGWNVALKEAFLVPNQYRLEIRTLE